MSLALPTASPALRYCGFVAPEHPLVDAVFEPRSALGGASREAVLDAALADLARRTVYRSLPGHRSFDALLAGWGERREPLVLNCINRSCLLVSYLRRAGVGAERVHVALAGLRRFLQHHAWTLLRDGEAFLWIDPADLRPRRLSGRAIADGHDLYTLFNDRELVFSRRDKRRLLGAGGDAG